jgi:glycosyltransferase involved in cell wall biosynthesis
LTTAIEEFDATVVIVTKNRADELRRAVRSAVEQRGAAIEVLVVDDGSTDETSQMIRDEFPGVVLDRQERSVGLVVERNRAARQARGRVIFSIDDDAVFSTPDVVAQTLRDFDDPRVGAVAIPFINKNQSEAVNQAAPDASGTFVVASYIGTAHAVRRELFLQAGGYRDEIVHQGEESDFTLRLLERGYFVRLGRSDPIFHYESPRRNLKRMYVYGWRNVLLFRYRYVPMPWMPLRFLVTFLSGVLFTCRHRAPVWFAVGVSGAVGQIVRRPVSLREPVRPETYELYRRLSRRPMPLEEATRLLGGR